MMRRDGGPAFPCSWTNDSDRNATAPDGQLVPPGETVKMQGASLRDLLAMNAPDPAVVMSLEAHCAYRYKYADAMLAAREHQGTVQ